MSRATLKAIQAAAGNAGEAVYVDDVFSTYVYQGTGSDAYPVQEIAVTGNSVTSATGLAFKSDGTKMYATSGSSAIPGILEFDLSTAWDVTTATYSQFGSTFDWCSDIWIDSTGTKVFVVSTASDHIGYYTLSTAWDISTISSRVASRSTSGESENNPQFIFLKPDGTELYYGGTDTDNVFQLGLSTAFDLSTASHDATFFVGSQESLPFALLFNSSGTRMYITGNSQKTFYQYNLSTAWDLSTASSNSNCPTGQAEAVSGMHIADGKLFAVFSGANPPPYKAFNMSDPDELRSVARNVITNGIDLAEEGGAIWCKGRSYVSNHKLFDTVRPKLQGALNKLSPNSVSSEGSDANGILSVNSDGFDTGDDGEINRSGEDQVAWTFRKQPGFFDVVTYTGDGTGSQDIPHNLTTTPGCIIVKRRDASEDWWTYHRGISSGNDQVQLNTTSGAGVGSFRFGVVGQNFDINSATFSVGGGSFGALDLNQSGATYVAYLFAHDAQKFGTTFNESIIECGTYTGDGSASGLEVDLGFEPQWLLVKTASGSVSHKNWWLLDSMRGIVASENEYLLAANLSDAETTGADIYDLTATGFIAKDSTQANQNGANYIYVAIRRPNKPASELTANDVFSVKTYAATTSSASVTHDVAFDMEMSANRGVASIPKYLVVDHLRGINGRAIRTSDDIAELNFPTYWSRKDQFTMYAPSQFDSWWAASSGTENHVSYAFKRTPEFFDIVAYVGNGTSGHTINHNLGSAPDLMIIRNRNRNGYNWIVYASSLGATQKLELNSTSTPSAGPWTSYTPTAVDFKINASNSVNLSGDNYIAYLFATVPGISKVGSYTGTGASLTIDCGFSSSARLVIIKSTTLSVSGAGWYVWDSARGITASVDPYLRLNETNAESSTASLDLAPDSSGFTIVGTNTNINGSGEEYIFLAIA